jgi:hypothetical protein
MWSDRSGEFGERRGDTQGGRCVGGEFVVAASEVLDEGVSGDGDGGWLADRCAGRALVSVDA